MLKKGFIFKVELWRGWVWFAFWNNVISTIPGSTICYWWTENDSKFRGLVGTEARHDDSSNWQRTVDTWMARFWNVDGPDPGTKPQNHESVLKKHFDKKSFIFKVELLIFERLGLVCFLEHRDFDDPGSDDLMNEENDRDDFRGPVGSEACRRTAPGYAYGR